MAQLNKRVELKYVLMEYGELFVNLAGVLLMPLYSVGDWDTLGLVCIIIISVLCYHLIGPSIYYNAYFGETYGPIIWSYVGCSGFETSIQSCNKNVQPNFNCTQQNSVGVLCKDCKFTMVLYVCISLYSTACLNGEVKLIGGKYSNEGTVLVCYNNLWGLISDTAWSNGDARVVCRSLGHSDGSK